MIHDKMVGVLDVHECIFLEVVFLPWEKNKYSASQQFSRISTSVLSPLRSAQKKTAAAAAGAAARTVAALEKTVAFR